MTTLFVWLLLVLLNLFVVRDYSWLVDNWDIKRVVSTILDIINMQPHENINGKSLLNIQDSNQLRVVSKYMPT